MTETTTFPFETGTQAPEGPAEVAEVKGNRRALVALVAALAVLVAGAAAYFLVFSGGDEDTTTPPRATAVDDNAGGTTSGGSGPVAKKSHHRHIPRISARNFGTSPFDSQVEGAPVVSMPDAGTTEAGAVTDPTGSTTTDGTTTTTDGTTTTTTGGTSTGGTSTGTTSHGPISFHVVSVADGNVAARVVVDGQAYSVALGDVFATYFKAISFRNGRCGTFQYGDQNFNLCEGGSTRLS